MNTRAAPKRQNCKYCSKLVFKLPRHLAVKHAIEPDVATFLALPLNCSRRKEIINRIRNEGNFIHNREVLAEKNGNLITKRRHISGENDNYVPCPNCLTLLKENYLSRHQKLCTVTKSPSVTGTESNIVIENSYENETTEYGNDEPVHQGEEIYILPDKSDSDDQTRKAPYRVIVASNVIYLSNVNQEDSQLAAKNDVPSRSKTNKQICLESKRKKQLSVKKQENLKTIAKERRTFKKQSCKFCCKFVQKLPRHLETKHADESEVVKLRTFEKGSTERRKLIDKIRNEGNYMHNKGVLAIKKGNLIKKRQIPSSDGTDNYAFCPNCFSTLKENYISRHKKRCHSSKKDEYPTTEVEYLSVQVSSKEATMKRWQKKQYCKYCQNAVIKLPRHLQLKHPHELQVSRFLALPKGSPQRREIVDRIRYEGNHLHNQEVLLKQKGLLVTKRLKSFTSKVESEDTTKYVSCPKCFSMLTENYLPRHSKRCSFEDNIKGNDIANVLFFNNSGKSDDNGNLVVNDGQHCSTAVDDDEECFVNAKVPEKPSNVLLDQAADGLENKDQQLNLKLSKLVSTEYAEIKILNFSENIVENQATSTSTCKLDDQIQIMESQSTSEQVAAYISSSNNSPAHNDDDISPSCSDNELPDMNMKENTRKTIRKCDKMQSCKFCSKCVIKLPRHLTTHHRNEPEVSEFIALPIDSKERRAIIDRIRNEGNYKHNQEVLKSQKKGELITKRVRQTNENGEYDDDVEYVACPYCHAMLTKDYMPQHRRRCTRKPVEDSQPELESNEQSLAMRAIRKRTCKFCLKCVLHLGRHLETEHATEPDVVKLMGLPQSSIRRHRLFVRIRREGNALRYQSTATKQPPLQSADKVDRKNNYKSCPTCFCIFKISYFYQHKKMCLGLTVPKEENADQVNTDSVKQKKLIKLQSCKFCFKCVQKLPRHLASKHSTEPEVVTLLAMPTGSTQRRDYLDKIRNEGNYAHNQEVRMKHEGNIIPKRLSFVEGQHPDTESYDEYKYCKKCFSMVKLSYLQRHVKRCSQRVTTNDETIQNLNSESVECPGADLANDIQDSVLQPCPDTNSDQDSEPYESTNKERPQSMKKWNKKQSCKFCLKLVVKLPRHLEVMHSSDPAVASFLSLAKGSFERRVALEKIRNEGNFANNQLVLSSASEGVFITKRRNILNNDKAEDNGQYVPCPQCFCMLKRKYIRRHVRNSCLARQNANEPVPVSKMINNCNEDGTIASNSNNTSDNRSAIVNHQFEETSVVLQTDVDHKNNLLSSTVADPVF